MNALAQAAPFFHWADYNLTCTGNAAAVNAIFRDRRFGREPVVPPAIPPHLAPFYAVEAHSMLELEPPRHTRLRNLVLRAFTSRRIAGLAPDITALTEDLVAAFPSGDFDLLQAFAQPLPVRIIARLLGVPAEAEPLYWRAVEIIQENMGHDHPTVAKALRRLAHLYEEQENFSEADRLYRWGLGVSEKALGCRASGGGRISSALCGTATQAHS
jgi:cytochrome P450